jgi:acetyl esterase/lipase
MSTPGDTGGAAPAGGVHQALTYAELQGFRPLLLDLHVPAAADATRPVPVVIWLHGGAFWAGDRRYLPSNLAPNAVFDTLVASGMAAATIDYRLSGEARFPAQLDDVRAAIRYLRSNASRWGLDAERVGVWGESSGGTLAALAALTPSGGGDDDGGGGDLPIAAAALWGAPTDLVALRHFSAIAGLLGDGTDEDLLAKAAQASPVTHVRRGAPPFLIMHGTADATLSIEQSELLHKELLTVGARSTFAPVEEAGHTFAGLPDAQPLVDRTVAFFAQEFAQAGTAAQVPSESCCGERRQTEAP